MTAVRIHVAPGGLVVTTGCAGVLVDCDGTLLDTNYLHTLGVVPRAARSSASGRR